MLRIVVHAMLLILALRFAIRAVQFVTPSASHHVHIAKRNARIALIAWTTRPGIRIEPGLHGLGTSDNL